MTIERREPEKGLTPWQPYRELEEMGRRFEDVFGRPFLPGLWRRFPSEEMVWAPAINVIEREDKFSVKVELPGVKEEDVNVTVAGGTLTIEGEKKAESEVKKKGYYYCETSYGSFSRSITIPSTVNASKIEASYDKGILDITLPKAPEVKPKKITVKKKEKVVQIEPIKPVKPIEPIKPVKPIEPIKPVKPIKPIKPVKPIKPIKPVKPIKPIKPV
jgi:HSP20 family protein